MTSQLPIALAMAAKLMDGKALAERIRGEVAEEVRELGEVGLATVLVGDDPASEIYIRLKHKAAGEVGMRARDVRLASQTTEDELLERGRAAERRRRDRRPPRAAAAARRTSTRPGSSGRSTR